MQESCWIGDKGMRKDHDLTFIRGAVIEVGNSQPARRSANNKRRE